MVMRQPPKEAGATAFSSERQWKGLEELDGALERRVMLENCVDTKVDIEALERLMEPANEEVSLRCILKYSTKGGSSIFQLFDTAEKNDHFVASRKRWLERKMKGMTLSTKE